MTESVTDPEGVDWGEVGTPEEVATWVPDDVGATKTVSYPEYGKLPEAPISINFRPGDKPQITVRGHCAADITAIFNDLEAGGVYANIAAAMATLQAQGQLGAGLGPVSPAGPLAAPAAPSAQQYPAGPPQPSQGPPPAWAAPPTPGYNQAPPQGGGWGGQQQGKAQAKPNPGGWYKTNARSGPGFDAWKAMREGAKDYVKGKIQWAGGPEFWVAPDIAQWVGQQGWPVVQG